MPSVACRAKVGAREGTRTPTPFRVLDPKSSASTSFATLADNLENISTLKYASQALRLVKLAQDKLR